MTFRQFNRISKAISDAKRYRMLERIANNRAEVSCGEVRSGLGITAATLLPPYQGTQRCRPH